MKKTLKNHGIGFVFFLFFRRIRVLLSFSLSQRRDGGNLTRGKFRPKCANLLTGILTAAAAAGAMVAVIHLQTLISAPTSLTAMPEMPTCLGH